MSMKYSRVASSDSSEVDFASPFNYESQTKYTGFNQFSPSTSSAHSYRSAFEYTVSHQGGTTIQQDQTSFSRNKTTFLNLCVSVCITVFFCFIVVITFPISGWFCFKVVRRYESLVVFRLGKQQPVKGQGIVFVIPCIDKCVKVDMRTKAFNVPPQKIFTNDNGIVEVGADVYFRTCDAVCSVMNVQDYNHALRLLTQTTMVKLIAKEEMENIDKNKLVISSSVQNAVNQMSLSWGLEVSRVELSQIKILLEAPVYNPLRQLHSVFPFLGGAEQLPPSYEQIVQTHGPMTTPVPTKPGKPPTLARELMEQLKPMLNEYLVRQCGVIYQFQVKGEHGGLFYLDLKTGTGSVGEGTFPFQSPDVTLCMMDHDLDRMFNGDLKPMQAYMSGQLKVSGDLNAAMKLEDIIDKLKTRSQVQIV